MAVAFINLHVISRQAQPTGPAGIYSEEPKQLAQKIGNDPMARYLSNYYRAQQYVYGDSRPEVWEWFIHAGGTSHTQELGISSLTPVGLFMNRYMQFFGALGEAEPPVREKVADMMSMRYFIGGVPFEQILWGNASRDIHIAERPFSLPRAFVANVIAMLAAPGSASSGGGGSRPAGAEQREAGFTDRFDEVTDFIGYVTAARDEASA